MLPHHPLVNGAMRRTKPTGSISTLRVICEPAMSGEPDRHPRLSGEASRSRRLLEIGEHNVARSSGFFEERGHLVDQLARLKAPRSPQCSKIERARLRQGRLFLGETGAPRSSKRDHEVGEGDIQPPVIA